MLVLAQAKCAHHPLASFDPAALLLLGCELRRLVHAALFDAVLYAWHAQAYARHMEEPQRMPAAGLAAIAAASGPWPVLLPCAFSPFSYQDDHMFYDVRC